MGTIFDIILNIVSNLILPLLADIFLKYGKKNAAKTKSRTDPPAFLIPIWDYFNLISQSSRFAAFLMN